MRWRFLILTAFCCMLSALCGCRAYNLGNQGLFPTDVRTVGVSIVANETWRHGYGERLTEALVREIETRTPYKVVPESRADMLLKVTITDENKNVTFQNDWLDPRELLFNMTVNVQWIDRKTMEERKAQNIDLRQDSLAISSSAPLVTEVGQSNATASQTVIQNLAQSIVGMMENPW